MDSPTLQMQRRSASLFWYRQTTENGGLIDASQPAVYIDCKLNEATPFTPAQQQIINNLNTDIKVTSSDIDELKNVTIKIKVAKKLATNDNLELVLK